MNVKTMKQMVGSCLDVGITPMIWGKHGIGKSAIIKEIGAEKGYQVIDLRLGQLEVGDLIGMPDKEYYCPNCERTFGLGGNIQYCPMCKKDHDLTVTPVGRTIWLAPAWFPQNGEKRLLFFDELNRGRLDVQQAAFQIVLDRRIHTHMIPSNCAIVCACNPSGADYYVQELDPALLDRFVNIKFTLDKSDWLGWARDFGITEEIIDFIGTDDRFLGNEAIDIPIDISFTPRSYEFLSKLCKVLPKGLWHDAAACIIGEQAAIAFAESMRKEQDKPIKAKVIFEKFTKEIKQQVAGQVEEQRFDLLRVTCDEILQKLDGDKVKQQTDAVLNNIGDFVMLIPDDLAFSVMKDLAAINDVNQRLLLKRQDLFERLKKAHSR